jgi:hypothetical protein
MSKSSKMKDKENCMNDSSAFSEHFMKTWNALFKKYANSLQAVERILCPWHHRVCCKSTILKKTKNELGKLQSEAG